VVRALSALSLAAMVAGVIGLAVYEALIASHWALRLLQAALMAWMIAAFTWSRRRGVPTTIPGLITSGPFAYLRHPIYAALIHFVWAGAMDHFSWPVLGWAETVTAGAFTRMHVEDHVLLETYPDYRAYKKRVKKLIPFVY
jgi:protein-S-isoprenylcysteine O-methyltransferase Ste14